ncbi:hypothetical protein BD770DRAFT_409532 [Pilaira anomala]|nr:hypothetical protein BD770DRAFT_409532 [Pilaira anomala]
MSTTLGLPALMPTKKVELDAEFQFNCKAEDYEKLNENKQLALDGIDYGKRVDFSVISTTSNQLLLILKANSYKTKHVNELVKLSTEMKDSLKAISADGYSNIIVSGLLLQEIVLLLTCS